MRRRNYGRLGLKRVMARRSLARAVFELTAQEAGELAIPIGALSRASHFSARGRLYKAGESSASHCSPPRSNASLPSRRFLSRQDGSPACGRFGQKAARCLRATIWRSTTWWARAGCGDVSRSGHKLYGDQRAAAFFRRDCADQCAQYSGELSAGDARRSQCRVDSLPRRRGGAPTWIARTIWAIPITTRFPQPH